MKTKIITVLVLLALLVGSFPLVAFAVPCEDIVILYENDVHCNIEGYTALSAMKKELERDYEHVGVVSSGDFLQGGSIGTISRGEYIVRLMNLVGYDAVSLGNHEFDYGLDRLYELSDMLDTKPVCSNFIKIGEGECFAPYSIVSYGDKKIAYIGITTPSTPEKTSFPSQFFDDAGNPIYSFCPDNLASVVQENIDKARAEGADYVIALSHLGDKEEKYNASEIVAETVGFDVVLDAHSHSVIESETLKDKNGNDVIYTSTGTKFENVGKLTISREGISTEIIPLENYSLTDPVLDECIGEIKAEYSEIGNRKIASCDFDLAIYDDEGKRIVRFSETNLGNLITDAFRQVFGSDIAYLNSGAIREEIIAGDVTFNDILNVLPYNNTGVMVEASGAQILKMLETAMMRWPNESGAFPQLSGIIFSVDTEGDKNKVYDVKVQNRQSGAYEPLDLEKKYTLSSTNFVLLEGGDGIDMFKDCKVISDTGILDVEVLEKYITEHLGGVIGEEYSQTKQHITFAKEPQTAWIIIGAVSVAVVAVAALAVAYIFIRKRKRDSNK